MRSAFLNQYRDRITEDGDCLRWTGGVVGKRAHPYVSVWSPKRKCLLVRRLVWEEARGPIPAGKIVHCTCNTPQCVSLEHLEITTFAKLAKQLGALGVMSGPVRSAKIAAAHRARHPLTKCTQEQVREIRTSDAPGNVLAARYGVSEATISKYRLNHCRREFGAANPFQGLGA
jgi:hypothetical protein